MAIVRDLIVLALCAIFLVHFSEGHAIKQRSIEPTAADTVTNNGGNTSNNGSIRTPTTEQPITEICIGRTPCGWAVYNRVNRFVEYFMKNKCICPEPRTCVRQDDDISITAYVYRCKIVDKNGEVVDSDNPFANTKSTK